MLKDSVIASLATESDCPMCLRLFVKLRQMKTSQSGKLATSLKQHIQCCHIYCIKCYGDHSRFEIRALIEAGFVWCCQHGLNVHEIDGIELPCIRRQLCCHHRLFRLGVMYVCPLYRRDDAEQEEMELDEMDRDLLALLAA